MPRISRQLLILRWLSLISTLTKKKEEEEANINRSQMLDIIKRIGTPEDSSFSQMEVIIDLLWLVDCRKSPHN